MKQRAILDAVPSLEREIQAARTQLERLLESSLFARSEQLSRLLRFLVERHLDGCDRELKESVIGVEVFGRTPDYNPKLDPIVRTEARRLRARLTEYYQSEGKDEAVRIEIPKGGYVPVVRAVAPAPGLEGPPSPSRESRPFLLVGVGLTVAQVAAALALLGASLAFWPQKRSAAYDLYIRARF